MTMFNQSIQVTEFLLHGLSDTPESRTFHFITFLFIYLMALSENLFIIIVIIYSPSLHKPMYFFLGNLALQDIGSISVTVPKAMANSLLNRQTISYNGCFCQVFFFFFFSASHFFLLGVMAYDRYLAICSPLQYEILMNWKTCIRMTTIAWITGLLYSSAYTGGASIIQFCSSDINQFFCEISKFYKIACSDVYYIPFVTICVGVAIAFIYILLIVFSYVQIFQVVLRMPSSQGKHKALSTCLPHLIVISVYSINGSVAYLKPESRSLPMIDIVISILYCMVPSVINPLIYSIRNKELKAAFWKLTTKCCSQLFFIKNHCSGFHINDTN